MHDLLEDPVRTTLDIDDDVLALVRARAEHERIPIGRVLSALARAALQPATMSPAVRNGLPVLPSSGDRRPVTLEIVNQLRDEVP